MNTRTYYPVKKDFSGWKCLPDLCRVFHTHGVKKSVAVHFAFKANQRIQALRTVAGWESSQIGERRTAEAAKKKLLLLAKHVTKFMRDDGPVDDLARGLLQRFWVEKGFPMTSDLHCFTIIHMIGEAATEAAGCKMKRGKSAVSEVEKLMWKNVAIEFRTVTGLKPVVSAGGLFAEAVSMIAKELVIDRPSRTVLAKCIGPA